MECRSGRTGKFAVTSNGDLDLVSGTIRTGGGERSLILIELAFEWIIFKI